MTRHRITTLRQLRERSRRFATPCRHRATMLAVVNSNSVHNPETGHLELAADTPPWVARVAARRGWIHNIGNLASKDGEAVKATLKTLGIKNTYKAIVEYLSA